MSYGELSNTQETMVMPLLQMKNIRGKPYITVSAKGMVNGLSNIPNDGADFGPDTTKGATAPGQYGSPYTETSGIQEAHKYAGIQSGQYNSRIPVYLREGTGVNNVFFVSSPININYDNSMIIGNGFIQSTDSSLNAFNIGNATTGISHLTIENVGFYNFTNVFNVVNTASSSFAWNFENLTFVGISNAILISTTAALGPTVNFVNCNGGAAYCMYLTVGADNINFIDSNMSGEIYVDLPSGVSTVTISMINSSLDQGSVSLTGSGIANSNYGVLMMYNSFITGNITLTNSVVFTYADSGIGSGLICNAGSYAFMYGNGYINGGTGTFYVIQENTGASGFVLIDGGYASNSSTGSISTDNGTAVPVIVRNVVNMTSSANIHLTSVNVNTTASPVSGTVYQNTNPYDIEIDLPVYATTSGTAGYVTVAKGATSTPTAIGNQFVSGSTSSTSTDIIKLIVPAGWYYEFTASGVTFGTASVFAD